MKTTTLLATTLLTTSLLTACDSLPLVGGGATGTDSASINQKRGRAIATMTEAQRKQYERQQNMELREAQIQAATANTARGKRAGVMNEITSFKEWLKTLKF